MTEDFDPAEFLDWLDGHDGAVPRATIEREWPAFPWDQLGGGITVALDQETGESRYYKRDLRRAARGQPNLD